MKNSDDYRAGVDAIGEALLRMSQSTDAEAHAAAAKATEKRN